MQTACLVPNWDGEATQETLSSVPKVSFGSNAAPWSCCHFLGRMDDTLKTEMDIRLSKAGGNLVMRQTVHLKP